MDASVLGTQGICDLHFAVFCDHPRTSFYTEPFHMCYYHGVETDLLNLTTYIGYELWRVSTTCGLFLESVRATGVIFFLGVGSLFCYKLFGYYRKKREFRKPKDRISAVSRQTIVSRWVSRELLDSCLNREPELSDIKKEYFGPVDYSDDEPSSSCSDFGQNKLNKEARLHLSGGIRKMGPVQSSSGRSKSVVYNVHTGVNFFEPESTPSKFEISGQSPSSLHPQNYSRNSCLPPTRRRKRSKSNNIELIFSLSTSSKDSRRSLECCDTEDDCSSKIDSDEELNYGDDEEDDDEFRFKKQSESLGGNYSLQSLWDRQHERGSESPDMLRKPSVFVMHSSRSASMSDEDCNDEEISDRSSIGVLLPGNSRRERSLCRDNSFGTVSEISEISVDVSEFNNIGKQTELQIEELEKEINDLKRDCMDMESHFGNVNAHGPTPSMYTELVKPCLSDISEGSDVSGEEKQVSEASLRKSIFKQKLGKSQSGGSADDSSFDNSAANHSANISLEWDSMETNNESVNKIVKQNAVKTDSGSDFGTPITNRSPEPTSAHYPPSGLETALSLEWDEEFSQRSLSKSDERKIPPSLPIQPLQPNAREGSKWNETPSTKNMWSSMESGYIDGEMTESGVSCLVTPMTDEKAVESNDRIRTWPVVGDKISTKQLCTFVHANNDFVKICCHFQIKYFRAVHKDGACLLRSVLLQMLLQGYSPLEHNGGLDHVKRTFSRWTRCNHKWLSRWSASNPCSSSTYENANFRKMFESLQSLEWLTGVVLSSSNVERAAVKTMNTDPEVESQVTEAAKILMLKSAIELYESMSVDKTVPTFALKLFNRDTSLTPEAFMNNHLNTSQPLNTLELFLLGYALGVTICVVSPDDKDEIQYYPDCKLGQWPEVYLIRQSKSGQIWLTIR